MSRIKKTSKSLKKRITRTFTVLNLISLLVLLILLSVIMGMLFSAFGSMVAESVATQMAEALTFNSSMKYGGLGEPYKLSNKTGEAENEESLYLIHYTISTKEGIEYDSIQTAVFDAQTIERISNLTLMKQINIGATATFMDDKKQPKGTVFVELNPLLMYFAYIAVLIVFAIGFIMVLVVSQIAVSLIGPNIIKPLGELEKKMNDMASGDMVSALSAQMTMKNPVLEVEQLANHANKILSTLNDYVEDLQTQKIKLSDQMQQLNHVFNQIDQGIVQIDANLLVGEAYSAEAKRLLGTAPENRALPVLLYSESDGESAFLEELLKQIFSQIGQMTDVYMSLLPQEISLNNKTIGLSYKLIEDHQEKPSMMVIMTDLTSQKALEADIEQEQLVLKMVVKALVYSDAVRMLVKSYETFAARADQMLSEGTFEDLQREVHTFKGSFAQYDWSHISEALGQLEEVLHEGKPINDALSQDNLMGLIEVDLDLILAAVGIDFLKESPQCLVEKEKILRIEDRIIELLSPEEQKVILPLVRELRYVSMKGYLSHYEEYVSELSQRLEKSVVLLPIEGSDVYLDPDIHESTFRSMVHLIRNAIDHGVESDNERTLLGKSIPAPLKFSLESDDRFLYIHLKDDGRGIDYEALRNQGIEKGYNKDLLETLPDEELPFVVNLSLKETVTQISGRGVGMSAVREAVEKTGGHISLNSVQFEGTEYTIALPLHNSSHESTDSDTFMEGISEVVDNLLCKAFGTCLIGSESVHQNKIVLDEMTAIVHLKGTLNLIVMLSVTKSFIRSLMPHLILYELEDEGDPEVEEDLLSEFSNTLLGNALRTFDQKEDIFHLGIPVIMSHSDGYIKYSQDTITSRQFERGQEKLGVHLIPIHSEFIVKRFEEA